MDSEKRCTVYIIDDDPAVARSLRWLIKAIQLEVELFASAQDFLNAYDATLPGCIVLDVRMPELSGLDLQEQLAEKHTYHSPIIFISGHGDIKMAVHAIHAGAYDFLEKPFRDQDLLDRIQKAIIFDREQRSMHEEQGELSALLATLSPREHEVFDLICEGLSNKAAAYELGLSAKTVEIHRAKVMKKLSAKSVADLVKISMQTKSQ